MQDAFGPAAVDGESGDHSRRRLLPLGIIAHCLRHRDANRRRILGNAHLESSSWPGRTTLPPMNEPGPACCRAPRRLHGPCRRTGSWLRVRITTIASTPDLLSRGDRAVRWASASPSRRSDWTLAAAGSIWPVRQHRWSSGDGDPGFHGVGGPGPPALVMIATRAPRRGYRQGRGVVKSGRTSALENPRSRRPPRKRVRRRLLVVCDSAALAPRGTRARFEDHDRQWAVPAAVRRSPARLDALQVSHDDGVCGSSAALRGSARRGRLLPMLISLEAHVAGDRRSRIAVHSASDWVWRFRRRHFLANDAFIRRCVLSAGSSPEQSRVVRTCWASLLQFPSLRGPSP